MKTVVVDEINQSVKNNKNNVSASIYVQEKHYHVWYEWPGVKCLYPADAYLLVSLFAAMRTHAQLVIKGSVSERLLDNISTIQDIYRCWDPDLSIIDVSVDEIRPWKTSQQTSKRSSVGCAFSGGVDSFYSVLKHREEIKNLIYIHGFDVSLKDLSLRRQVSHALLSAATRLGKRFIEVETNLRDFSDRYQIWHLAVGGGLASVGILLSSRLSRFLISAGQTYSRLIPDGAHPVLNRCFSTDAIDFEADGCETARVDKVKEISSNEIVMDTLRVCWENRGRTYNCCRCEKCLRTMVSLYIVGALDRCRTFTKSLDLARIANTIPRDPDLQFFSVENLEAARKMNADPLLIEAIEKSMNMGEIKRTIMHLHTFFHKLYKWIRFPHWGN